MRTIVDIAEVVLLVCLGLAALSLAGTAGNYVKALRERPVETSTRRGGGYPGESMATDGLFGVPEPSPDRERVDARREVLDAARILADTMGDAEPGPEHDLHDEIIGVCEAVARLRSVGS